MKVETQPVPVVKTKVEYKPYVPLPVVHSNKGDYLDVLSGTGSQPVSGSAVSGQSSYLDALKSQSTEPALGTELRGYLDNVSTSETILFTGESY